MINKINFNGHRDGHMYFTIENRNCQVNEETIVTCATKTGVTEGDHVEVESITGVVNKVIETRNKHKHSFSKDFEEKFPNIDKNILKKNPNANGLDVFFKKLK